MTRHSDGAMEDGLVRVRVQFAGKSTSVSLDGVLFRYLARAQGGAREAGGWIRAAVTELEAMALQDGSAVHLRAGLSRRVQRLALEKLLGDGEKIATV